MTTITTAETYIIRGMLGEEHAVSEDSAVICFVPCVNGIEQDGAWEVFVGVSTASNVCETIDHEVSAYEHNVERSLADFAAHNIETGQACDLMLDAYAVYFEL
jgi:hypothetical protein